jgi:hypothetical protein
MERSHASFSADFNKTLPDEDFVKSREERAEVLLPGRLVRSSPGVSDDVIPVMIANVSASGVQLVTDQRFSLSLPPFLGARFMIEFFFEALEVRHVVVEVVRSEKRQGHRIHLGCKFVDLPTQARLSLRSMIAARLASTGR